MLTISRKCLVRWCAHPATVRRYSSSLASGQPSSDFVGMPDLVQQPEITAAQQQRRQQQLPATADRVPAFAADSETVASIDKPVSKKSKPRETFLTKRPVGRPRKKPLTVDTPPVGSISSAFALKPNSKIVSSNSNSNGNINSSNSGGSSKQLADYIAIKPNDFDGKTIGMDPFGTSGMRLNLPSMSAGVNEADVANQLNIPMAKVVVEVDSGDGIGATENAEVTEQKQYVFDPNWVGGSLVETQVKRTRKSKNTVSVVSAESITSTTLATSAAAKARKSAKSSASTAATKTKTRTRAKKAATTKAAAALRKRFGSKTALQRHPLSAEQLRTIEHIMTSGESVFITGSAGTGKSALLAELIAQLRGVHGKKAVAITASTGIAAFNIGGATLHSFAGIGLGDKSTEKLIEQVTSKKTAKRRWMNTKVLIIDEISMIDGALFDKLDAVARAAREVPNEPFGGLQLVVLGDFFQLPPVNRMDDTLPASINEDGSLSDLESPKTMFCFESTSWQRAIHRNILLKRVFRQRDAAFAQMLEEVRLGTPSATTVSNLTSLCREPTYPDDGILPTELFPLRAQVAQANETRLRELPGESHFFDAIDGPPSRAGSTTAMAALNSNCIAPQRLELRVGAQVMLVKNMPMLGLVNGSRGVVTRFKEVDQFGVLPVVQFTRTFAESSRLAAGLSKRQKQQKSVAIDAANPPATTSEQHAVISSGSPSDYDQSLEVVVFPEKWAVKVTADAEMHRTQIPLVLAWALSIHKSQGQSLDRVFVNMTRIFESGQTYVALSRATSTNGLQVVNFHPNKVMAHPKVVQFYNSLNKSKFTQVL